MVQYWHMDETRKLKIAVLCGGFSNEREVSLLSGANVAKSLSREKYLVAVIDVIDATHWQLLGEGETPQVLDLNQEDAKKILQGFDVFFNVLHGAFGEDGQVQVFLDSLGICYTGSGAEASRKTMDKRISMEAVKQAGMLVAEFFVVDKESKSEEVAKKIAADFRYPVIVKPNDSGSTIGLSLVQNEGEVAESLRKALEQSPQAIVQRYIFGREFTCGVFGNNTRGVIHPLPPVEVIIRNKVFDYNDKYFSKETQELCPAPIDMVLTKKIQDLALLAHRTLGCDGLSRSDFRMDGIGKLFFLETNTSPGMAEVSLCPKEALAAGMTMPRFLDRLIELARERVVVQ